MKANPTKYSFPLIILMLISTLHIAICLNSDTLFTKPYVQVDHVEISNLTSYEYQETVQNYDSDLKENIDELEKESKRLKIVSCLLLIKNLLSSSSNKVVDTIKKSKLDKSLTFDKIYAEMMYNCVSIIEEDTCDKILEEKNSEIIDDLNSTRYLKFESKKFLIIGPQPKLSEEEEELMKEIEKISNEPEFAFSQSSSSGNQDYSAAEFSLFKGRGFYIGVGGVIGFTITLAYLLFK